MLKDGELGKEEQTSNRKIGPRQLAITEGNVRNLGSKDIQKGQRELR